MRFSAHKFGGASVSDAQAIQRVGQLLSDQIEAEERAVVVVRPWAKPPTPWKQCGRPLPKASVGNCGWPAWRSTWRSPKPWACRPRSWKQCAVAWKAAGKPRNRCAPNPWMRRMTPWWRQGNSQAPRWWRPGFQGRHVGGMVGCARHAAHLRSASLRAWTVHVGRSWNVTAHPHGRGPRGGHPRLHRATRRRQHEHVGQGRLRLQRCPSAVAVGAAGVTIWKDVPGMMNADPKRHPEAVTVPKSTTQKRSN